MVNMPHRFELGRVSLCCHAPTYAYNMSISHKYHYTLNCTNINVPKPIRVLDALLTVHTPKLDRLAHPSRCRGVARLVHAHDSVRRWHAHACGTPFKFLIGTHIVHLMFSQNLI